MLYPDLRHKYGDVITYEDNPAAHLKTEFGFDVLEVAKGRFAPQAYHEFIGFHVAKDLLERAVEDTYGIQLNDLFRNFDRAAESYRRDVSKTIPMATRVAWSQRRDEIQRSEPGITHHRFVYVMKRSSYERNWGKQYDRPTLGDRILAVLLKLIPPIGPLKTLRFKMPIPAVETLFMQSFDRSAKQYRARLEDVLNNRLHLEDRNYDVGVPTPAGVYWLDDNVQAYWLDLLARKNFRTVTPAISAELLNYYGNLKAPIATKKHPKQWNRVVSELTDLKTAAPKAAAAGEQ